MKFNTKKIAPIDIAIFMVSIICLCLTFIRVIVFGPGTDGTEFAYAAWLVAHGKILYVDFFQNHSPWYIFLISSVFNTNSVFFVLNLSLFHWSLAVFGAVEFAWIIWLEAASDDPSVRRRSAFISFLFFISFYRAFATQLVRPETLCVVALMTAVLYGKGTRGAGQLSSWIRTIGFALCIGLAVCLTPRASLLATAIVLWVAWENRGPGSWTRIAVALAGAAIFLLAIIARVVSLREVYHWVIVFNGHLPISHHLREFVISPKHNHAAVFIITSIIIVTKIATTLLRGKFNNYQDKFIVLKSITEDSRFIYVESSILLSFVFLHFDRIWVEYSFDFITLLYLYWLALAGIHVSRRLSQEPKMMHTGLAFAVLALLLLWNIPSFLLGGGRSPPATHEAREIERISLLYRSDYLHLGNYLRDLADIGHPAPEQISLAMLKPSGERLFDLAGWLRWSKDVCAAAQGQPVVLLSARPICAPDASYYWVRWPQLPMSDLANDIRVAKPIIIEKICPPVERCSMNPVDPHSNDYVDAGWAWIRRDLARRLSPPLRE